MDKKEINKKVSEGYLHVRAIIEVVGKPKVHVEKTLNDYIKNIKDNVSQKIIDEEIAPPEEKDGFFSTFVELEMLFEDSLALLNFCFDYMPSSMEISAPERIVINNSNFAGFINDLQARLHALNTGIIELKDSNKFYVKNTAVLLRNFIVVLLSSKSMTIDQMHPYLGVKKEDIQKVLNVLIKEEKVKKDGNKYSVLQKK